MTLSQRFRVVPWLMAVLTALSAGLIGCASPPSEAARLRITNGGIVAIENLTILFPEDEIVFGDIAVGSTTEYRTVPNGVYGYAAYRLVVNGQVMTQPVSDWVGEKPMPGHSFTYTLDFDPDRQRRQTVQLIGIIRDE